MRASVVRTKVKGLTLPRRPHGRPGVTVVIPCYNYGHFLPAAVAAALDQPAVEVSVIIVDDASPDGSGAVAQRLARENPRVRALIHPENRGHIQTYNDGLALVETEYATLVSADDLVAEGALTRAAAFMQQHPRVGLVYGTFVKFRTDADPHPRSTRPYHLWRLWAGDEWLAYVTGLGRAPIASPEAVVRTVAMRQVGLYNAGLPRTGDHEYWLRIAARWDVGQIIGRVQAYYRVHGDNMHIHHLGSREDDLRGRFEAFKVLLDKDIVADLPTAPARFDAVRRTLAAEVDALRNEQCAQGADTASLSALRRQLNRVAADYSPAGDPRAGAPVPRMGEEQ